MEVNDIKIFYEVAKLRSTIKTANKLGYVQSNISKRIAKLESELGRRLFYRTNKGMTLTVDGEKFLTYAEKVLAAISEMEDYFAINKNQIRIGATQSISINYLQNYYADENVSIFTRSTSELIQELENCNIDIMVINRKIDNAFFKEIDTLEEKIFWTKAKTNNVDFLVNKVAVSRDIDCPYRTATYDYLHENRVDVSIIEVDTIDILTSMVENNNVIAILPEKTIAKNEKLCTINHLTCDKVLIHIYTLISSTVQFKIKSTTKCDAQQSESNFQTHPSRQEDEK